MAGAGGASAELDNWRWVRTTRLVWRVQVLLMLTAMESGRNYGDMEEDERRRSHAHFV